MYSTVEQEISFLDKLHVRDMHAPAQTDTNVCQANFGLHGIALIQLLYMDMVQSNGCAMPFAGCLDRELQSNKPCQRAGLNLHNGNGYAECNSHAVSQSQQLN